MRREVEAGRPVAGGAHGRRREARQGRGRPARGEARGADGGDLARVLAAGVTLSSPASSCNHPVTWDTQKCFFPTSKQTL
ncbi:unnamed protein product [Urochloa humidicola]